MCFTLLNLGQVIGQSLEKDEERWYKTSSISKYDVKTKKLNGNIIIELLEDVEGFGYLVQVAHSPTDTCVVFHNCNQQYQVQASMKAQVSALLLVMAMAVRRHDVPFLLIMGFIYQSLNHNKGDTTLCVN